MSVGLVSHNVFQAGLVPLSGYLNIRMSDRNYKTEIRGISLAWCYAMPSQVLGDVPTSPCYLQVFFYRGLFYFCPNTQNLKKDFARRLVRSACRSEIVLLMST